MLKVTFLRLFCRWYCISWVDGTVEGLQMSPPVLLQATMSVRTLDPGAPKSTPGCSAPHSVPCSDHDDPLC